MDTPAPVITIIFLKIPSSSPWQIFSTLKSAVAIFSMTSSSPSLAFCSNFSAIFSSSSMKNFYGFASGYQFSILIGQPIETFLGTSIFFSLVCHFAEILFWMISLWQEQYAFGTIELSFIIKITYRGYYNRMVIGSNGNASRF